MSGSSLRPRLGRALAALVPALALSLLVAAPAALARQAAAPPPAVAVPERTAPTGLEALRQNAARPAPLGADLFAGGAPTYAPTIQDSGYVLKPGDQVRVTLFGLAQQDGLLPVDARGNIVVPTVGPVAVGGVSAGEVDRVVRQAVGAVYSEGVQVYAAAVAGAPIKVYVTGPVKKPGAYPAGANDSIVTLLQRAGGIEEFRGSYRRIRVVRRGQTLAEADLYAFLRDGTLPNVQFQDGDAVVVADQGPIVSVEGAVRAPFTFEMTGTAGEGGEIMTYARPWSEATDVAVVGVRQGQPYTAYVPLLQFVALPLQDGDRVRFEQDVRAGQVLVRVQGAHEGPSMFTVPRDATVGSVLARVTLAPSADTASIYLQRESVRLTQKQLLDESLARLERAAFTAPMRTAGEATARSQEAEFVTAFVERARQVQPLGVVTLAGTDPNAVVVEPNDVIVVPERSQVVTIAGEVAAPQAVIFRGGRVGDYVRQAGGYAPRADRKRVMVIRPDGGFRTDGTVQPGDRILVPTRIDGHAFALAKDLTQILYQIAIAAEVVL